MKDLKHCAYNFSKKYSSEEIISKEEINNILAMTDELFDSIENSNFSDILHATLLEEVEKIRHAIAMYKIEGIQGL